jgi:hypothetical protein
MHTLMTRIMALKALRFAESYTARMSNIRRSISPGS